MYLSLPSLSLALQALSSLTGRRQEHGLDPHKRYNPTSQHAKVDAAYIRRQIPHPEPEDPMPEPVEETSTTSASSRYIYTLFTPSPSAPPIAITKQSQVETSWVPQITICALPPLAFFAETHSTFSTVTSGPPYRNYSISTPPGNGTCFTEYSPTLTTICATVLNGLASRVTVSECNQEITFSSHSDAHLESTTPFVSDGALITPAPTIRLVTTYYRAPWQALTTAGPPSDVDVTICSIVDGEEQCLDIEEVWEVKIVTVTSTLTTTVDLSTTITGPAMIMVETYQATVTKKLTMFSLSTELVMHYEIEEETTMQSNRTEARTTTEPPATQTLTLEYAPGYSPGAPGE